MVQFSVCDRDDVNMLAVGCPVGSYHG